MSKYLFFLLFLAGIIFSSNVLARCAPDKNLPLREVFLTVDCMSAEELAHRIEKNDVVVVDARTKTEYEILKIVGSTNIDVDKKQRFINDLKNLADADKREIVFYCNGKMCNLSYRAGTIAKEIGIESSYVYDGGIFKFSKVAPTMTLLFDREITPDNKPISSEQFKSKLLSLDQFEQQITEHVVNKEGFRILDIRDKSSHHGSSAFAGIMNEKYISLAKTKKLKKYLKKVALKNIPLYVYDWAGTKLKWVQYYIEQQGIKEYYLLNGGAFHKINRDLKNEGLPPLAL